MRVHRVTFQVFAAMRTQAFNGEGGLHGAGRWHHPGRLVVYTSEHLSLAALELLVHLQRSSRIQPCVSYQAEIPDALIETRTDLPADWQTNETATRRYGDAWLVGMTAPALRVPSVIVPSEWNVLLNRAHPQFDPAWVDLGPEPFNYDPRLTHP